MGHCHHHLPSSFRGASFLVCGRFSPTCGVASNICQLMFVAFHSWLMAVFIKLWRCRPHLPSSFRGASFLVCFLACGGLSQFVAPPTSTTANPQCSFCSLSCPPKPNLASDFCRLKTPLWQSIYARQNLAFEPPQHKPRHKNKLAKLNPFRPATNPHSPT